MLLAIGTFLGGLGLFLLAVSMITDGLKIATGNALREILARSTGTRWRGTVSGAALTAMVQSSSAVTIATIGFVNAGLLGIMAALSIVVGATIGTTMTAWLVAVVGFQFSISSFALPMIGIGMMLRLIGPSRRMGAVGEAMAGFGLFFIGVDVLRGAFEGVTEAIDIANMSPDGMSGILMFAGLGMVMTVLTQSSSASIAITLSAVAGGLIGFPAAAAIMIGAKIGTTSTSALAVIGATANAKRIAVGHVAINSFNAVTGLLFLPLASWALAAYPHLQAYPILSLAIYYTAFNVAGAIALQALLGPLVSWLEKRFVSPVEALGRPQYLDRNVLVAPALALDAFLLELQRMAAQAREHAVAALSNEGPVSAALQHQHDGLRKLVLEIERFVVALEAERIHKLVAEQLTQVLRIANYIDEMVAQAQENTAEDKDLDYLMQTPLRGDIAEYQLAIIRLIGLCDTQQSDFNVDELESEYQALHSRWRTLKTALLTAGVRKQVPMQRLNPAIETLRSMLRVAERATRIATRLSELSRAIPVAGGVPASREALVPEEDTAGPAVEDSAEPASQRDAAADTSSPVNEESEKTEAGIDRL